MTFFRNKLNDESNFYAPLLMRGLTAILRVAGYTSCTVFAMAYLVDFTRESLTAGQRYASLSGRAHTATQQRNWAYSIDDGIHRI
jgi:hypothetical protein